jgi:predicted MPP superfamily phosphohydrolase
VKLFKINIALWVTVAALSCNSSHKIEGRQAKTTADFNFFVLGDWGRDGKFFQQDVAKQMIEKASELKPSFLMLTGDNFYDDGVKDIYDSHWKASFTDIYKELTQKYPWYVSLGNHDYRGNPNAQIDYHAVNRNWILPKRYYSSVVKTNDGQAVRLICIDTSPWYSDYYTAGNMIGVRTQDTAAQRKWLTTTLANAKEPWKIVFGHHQVYSAALRGGTPELEKILAPLLEKYKVQAYICGHDHNLQHNNPDNGYTDYFVSGGGSEVKDNPSFNKAKFAISSAGFADISIKGDSLSMSFINKDGAVIYRYARAK